MIRKFYLTVFIVLMSFKSIEQSIVYDPTNGAQIASMLGTIKELKESADSWKANADFINNVMNSGSEVKRLITMLEGMICATDELQLYMGMAGGLELCENKLELDITFMKIEGVSEKLNWIATGGILMTQYETVQSLKDLNDQLEEAIRKVNSLNKYMRGNVLQQLLREYDRKHPEENYSMLTQMNL